MKKKPPRKPNIFQTQRRRFYEFRQLRERADEVTNLLRVAAVAGDEKYCADLTIELDSLERKAELLTERQIAMLRVKS